MLRVSGPSDIPLGTLQGRRDDGGTRIRVTLTRTLAAARLGEFSLVPGQAPVPVVFVPLSLLQRELTLTGRVNTILVQQTSREGAPDASLAHWSMPSSARGWPVPRCRTTACGSAACRAIA